ncbi:MAG: hypothetical protein AAGA38_07830 [Pseudomonadota bacterium]
MKMLYFIGTLGFFTLALAPAILLGVFELEIGFWIGFLFIVVFGVCAILGVLRLFLNLANGFDAPYKLRNCIVFAEPQPKPGMGTVLLAADLQWSKLTETKTDPLWDDSVVQAVRDEDSRLRHSDVHGNPAIIDGVTCWLRILFEKK